MTQQPRFCNNCGGPLVAGARFCVACGTPVAVAPPPEPPAAAWPPKQAAVSPPPPERFYAPVQQSFAPPPFMPEQMAPAPPPKKKGSSRGCTLLGCGGLLVLLAAGGYGAYAYFTGSLTAANLPIDLAKLVPGLATPAAPTTTLPAATVTLPAATATATTAATAAVPTATPTSTRAPTATVTPAPTATSTPTPVVVTYQKGNQLYLETFTGAVAGWPLASDANIKRFLQDGRYNLQTIPAKFGDWNCSSKIPTLSDMVAEVTMRLEEGPATNAYGILFRYVDGNNFYRLQLTPAGRWEFGRQVNGVYSSLTSWKEKEGLPWNMLPVTVRVVAKGGTFAFFANGAQLGAVADPSLASGGICLSINALGDGPGRLSFDEVTVWEVAK